MAEETGRIHREAQAAAEKLEGLLRERDADRKQLAETQEALREAVQHLEEVSDEAQVPLNIAQDNLGTGMEQGSCGPLRSLLVKDVCGRPAYATGPTCLSNMLHGANASKACHR